MFLKNALYCKYLNSKGLLKMSKKVKVRCPNCRGMKQVYKLGGILGECDKCEGSGKILESELPQKVEAVEVESVIDIKKAVSEAVAEAVEVEQAKDAVKATRKNSIYKKKTKE